jgi:hypothetical protein
VLHFAGGHVANDLNERKCTAHSGTLRLLTLELRIFLPADPDFPTDDPTAGMADVPWEMTIADYRLADGLNWPHRMVTTVGADKYEELRLSRFRLNPAIDAKVFAPRN